MRRKDDLAAQRILECAKEEFMGKGYAEASVRAIAERAGYTTGMLYARFADKDELFRAVVSEGGDKLYRCFLGAQEEFASFPAERQLREMHTYVDRKMDEMIDIIYDYFDEIKLIVCKSSGSSYEYYVDKMIEIETDHTVRYVELMRACGIPVPEIRADLNHMLASALFNGVFEAVAHDMPREDAVVYVGQLQKFFNAGWDVLFGLK